jgi:hypothetical protein
MTIDLSQFVGKIVDVTFRDGTVYKECRVEFALPKVHSILFIPRVNIKYLNEFGEALNFIYFLDGQVGINGVLHLKDIIDIQLSVPEQKPMNNTLDTNTLHLIAAALKPGAIKFIESHEKYAEVITQLLTEYVENNLGDANGELPFMILDAISLK